MKQEGDRWNCASERVTGAKGRHRHFFSMNSLVESCVCVCDHHYKVVQKKERKKGSGKRTAFMAAAVRYENERVSERVNDYLTDDTLSQCDTSN